MLVQCPKCKTTYKVSDDVVKGAAAAFRCSRCKHTFELQVTAEIAPDASSDAGPADQNNELAFTFQPVMPEKPVARGDAAPPTELDGMDRVGKSLADDSKTMWPPDPGVQLAAPVEGPYPTAQPPRESSDNVLDIEPYRNQRASVMPFLTLFGLIIIFFAFVLAYQKTHPDAWEGWVARIPLLGPSVVRNDHLKNGVYLKSVETKFQILQGNREAVVLTGVAVNQNPVMIRNVQLSAQLFDHEGKEIERQTMWIGNAISLKIIRGMTAQDVTDLQRLKPLKTFEIPPGDSVPFAIVFLRPGKLLKDARCEVLSVEGV
jgi:predicted Zn finger-like uncharacterized protein